MPLSSNGPVPQTLTRGIVFAAAGFCWLVLAACSWTQAAERPNIILVMADDQGWGDMAYNGHPVLKTPNFDAMARNGLRMDRFYAAAPVCSPTRASVLTGRHPNRIGVFKWGYPLRPQEETIAEILGREGYATAHFGKWHLGSVRKGSPAHPGAAGFDEWISAPNFFENDPILSRRGVAEKFTGESSMLTMQLAIDWINRKTSKDQPFLAVVWFGSPHGPHVASEQDKKIYSDQPVKKQNFYGEVSGMDRAIGLLQKSLDQLDIKDNTLVWYISDNGGLPNVGSTGGFRANKGKVYEGGLLVPSILQWPAKIKRPSSTSFRGNSCDILPTLLEVVGIDKKPAHPIDGVSLVSLFDGGPAQRKKPMGFWDYQIRGLSVPSGKLMKALLDAQQNGGDLKPDDPSLNAARLPQTPFSSQKFPGHAAWIDGNWKLHRIEDKKGVVRYELYDLEKDPRETTDLAGQQTEKRESMRKELRAWLISVVDSLNGKDYDKP